MFRRLLSLAAVSAVFGCGGDDLVSLRLERVPTADPECGSLASATSIRVRALGEFPVDDSASQVLPIGSGEITIGSFDPRLQAVAVEVLGPDGDDVLVGRSPSFDFEAAEDGQTLPVFLAAPNGACPVGELASARGAPLAARLGDGALVLGGFAGDQPVADVERFDLATGAFETLSDDHYGTGNGGFIGATLTAVGSRVVAIGGPATAWQIWNDDATSNGPQFLPEARAFHAALALDDSRVLVAGGCAQVDVDSRSCVDGTALRTSSILDIDTGELERGPRLSGDRIGGRAYLDVDGTVVLAGGTDADGLVLAASERLDFDADEGTEIPGLSGGSSAQRLSGSVVAGFGVIGQPSDDIRTLGAGAAAGIQQLAGEVRAGASLTTAEDGQLLVVGGGGGVARLRPFAATVLPLDVELGGPRFAHAAVALGDGSVLVVGGLDDSDEPRTDAWLFRPPILGPLSNRDLSARFGDFEAADAWVPSDPEALVRVDAAAPYGELRSAGAVAGGVPRSYALVAGPLYRRVAITATVSGPDGLALLVGFSTSGSWIVTLDPGQPAALLDREGGAAAPIDGCSTAEVVADADVGEDGEPVVITATIDGDSVVVRSGERLLLRCSTEGEAPLGAVGVGALGEEGSAVRIDAFTVSRRVR